MAEDDDTEVVKSFNFEGFREEANEYLNEPVKRTRGSIVIWTMVHGMLGLLTAGFWVAGYGLYHFYKGYERFKKGSRPYYTYARVEEISEDEAESESEKVKSNFHDSDIKVINEEEE